jgi:hypothetical protein
MQLESCCGLSPRACFGVLCLELYATPSLDAMQAFLSHAEAYMRPGKQIWSG